MEDRERYKLIHGPYKMRRCRIGGLLFCELHGWVKVKRISDGRIPWRLQQSTVDYEKA